MSSNRLDGGPTLQNCRVTEKIRDRLDLVMEREDSPLSVLMRSVISQEMNNLSNAGRVGLRRFERRVKEKIT